MITFSIDRHHKGMNTFYTKEANAIGIKTIHSFDREKILRRFFELVKEDIVIHAKKVLLPIGLFKMYAFDKSYNPTAKRFIDNKNTKSLANPVYHSDLTYGGYSPYIKWEKSKLISNLRNWRLYVRNSTRKLMGVEFTKDYKKYIK